MARKEVKLVEEVSKPVVGETEEEADFSEDIFDGLESLN